MFKWTQRFEEREACREWKLHHAGNLCRKRVVTRFPKLFPMESYSFLIFVSRNSVD